MSGATQFVFILPDSLNLDQLLIDDAPKTSLLKILDEAVGGAVEEVGAGLVEVEGGN